MKPALVAFFAGALFAVGLAVAGMTEPAKVVGFLDVAGAWDPTLAFVMVGAIGVHLTARRFILRLPRPLVASAFHPPRLKTIDAPLIVGSAIFGVGWAVSGYCPGPALVTLGTGSTGGVVFAVAMATGVWMQRALRSNVGRHVTESIIADFTSP